MKAEPIEITVKIEVNGKEVCGSATFGKMEEKTFEIPIKVEVAKPKPKLKGFRIWYKGIKNDDGRPILRLLDEFDTGEIALAVVDPGGSTEAGRLLTIFPNGSFMRHIAVRSDIPIQRDEQNSIVERV